MKIPHHGKYQWLPILYRFVASVKPKKIVEFGPGRGFTTVTMAKALSDYNIDGHIKSYDMWVDEYWGDSSTTQNTYKEWGVTDYITLDRIDFFEWVKEPEEFDFLYFDVDNTGEKLEILYNGVKDQIKNGSVVFFEGGSKERDLHGVSGKNMYDVKDKIGYEILTENIKYSASTIYDSKIYDMDFE